jgi:hypothetical protein
MSVEIGVICSGMPDVPVASKVADLILGRCLNGYVELDVERGSHLIDLKRADIWLSAVAIPEGYHEFPGENVVTIRSERRNPRSFLACLVVSSTVAYCFAGRFDLDNWMSKSVAEPAKILTECLRYEDREAQWLLDRLAEVK